MRAYPLIDSIGRLRVSAVAALFAICLVCRSSIAEKIATTNSANTPPITSHSPQSFMNLQRLKSSMFFGNFCSEYCSIKSPAKTTKAPNAAITTYQKPIPWSFFFM
jgi:hypothetical protein